MGVKFGLQGTVTPRIKHGRRAIGQIKEQETGLFVFACVGGAVLVQRSLERECEALVEGQGKNMAERYQFVDEKRTISSGTKRRSITYLCRG